MTYRLRRWHVHYNQDGRSVIVQLHGRKRGFIRWLYHSESYTLPVISGEQPKHIVRRALRQSATRWKTGIFSGL